MQKEWRMVMMTVALVGAFFITFLPFAVSHSISVFGEISLPPAVDLYTTALTTFSSVVSHILCL